MPQFVQNSQTLNSPSDLEDNPLDLNYIYYNWAKWYDSDNSQVKAWRIQP